MAARRRGSRRARRSSTSTSTSTSKHESSSSSAPAQAVGRPGRAKLSSSWVLAVGGKVHDVEAALEAGDVGRLAVLCVTGHGLVNDYLRRRAWRLLLEADQFGDELAATREPRAPRPRDVVQSDFLMDVERSVCHFACDQALPSKERFAKRALLTTVLAEVLLGDPSLHYYQGLHDVCTVHLHVAGDDVAVASRCAALTTRQLLADHARSDFSTTVRLMDLLPAVLARFDGAVHSALAESGAGPMFALSWVITGFAHSIQDLDVVSRIYDAMLACHPLLCVYLSAAMLLRPRTRARLLRLAGTGSGAEPGTGAGSGSGSAGGGCDMAAMHHFLQHVPPPCMPLAHTPWKARARIYKAKRAQARKRQAAGVTSGQEHFPESAEEEAENSVDVLVTSALQLMGAFPPEDLIRAAEASAAEASAEAAAMPDSLRPGMPAPVPALPAHSMARVSGDKKAFWGDVRRYVKVPKRLRPPAQRTRKELVAALTVVAASVAVLGLAAVVQRYDGQASPFLSLFVVSS